MKRRNSEAITEVLHRFLRQEGLEGPLNEYRLLASWKEVVGSTVVNYTGKLSIRNQTLLVELRSPALRADLMMRRAELVQALNAKVGATVIYDIHFV